MAVLKWIVVVLAVIYLGGVVVLYFRQGEMLFPIPPVGRTAPDAAGLPEAEEHVLTTVDGEKVIVWHVPAKPGHAVVLYFPGNGDFLAGRASRFRAITSDGTASSRCPIAAMRDRRARRARWGCCRTPPPLMPSPPRAIPPIASLSGAFRSAPAWPSQ